MTSLRVLITGGAGFIGSRLARRLAADGHRVVVLDSLLEQVHGRRPPPPPPSEDVEVVWADVRDGAALERAMHGVDVVHHLAAETGVGQSQYEIGRYVGVNTFGTALVLQAAVEAGVGQVVIASSRAVYGEGTCQCPACAVDHAGLERSPIDMDAGRFEIPCPRCGGPTEHAPMAERAPSAPTSIYGLTKVQQEQLAAAVCGTHGLAPTILRLFNVYGPGQSLRNPYVGVLGVFFRRISAGEPVELYEDGRMLRDFVFVEDVVEAFRRSTGEKRALGRTWNVGSGRAVALGELAGILSRTMGAEPRTEISGRYRVGDVRHAVADVSLLDAELGYVPATPLEEGLTAFATWATENWEEAPDRLAEDQLASRNLLRQAGR